MNQQYDPNPLKDITIDQAIYLNSTAPIGSEVWINSGYVLSNYQQSLHSKFNKPLTPTPKGLDKRVS